MGTPTATTFFPKIANADKTKIQGLLDKIATGASRESLLLEANRLGSQMGGDERAQLVSMVYQQLAAR